MDSIFSITMPGFMFFLLIVCVGYVAVGDLSTKTKSSRFVAYKNKGSLERLIYYVLRGIGINLIFLLLFFRSKRFLGFIDSAFVSSRGNLMNIQAIIATLSYFLILVLLVWLIKKICIGVSKLIN